MIVKVRKINLSLILLLLKTTLSFDRGCREQYPKRCPNYPGKDTPICKKDYEECDGFEGCVDTRYPYLCSNGECAENFYNCKEKYFTCESSKETKCIDGLCREDCSQIRYSSCHFDFPIRCPDGSCVENDVECASPQCPADEPFICPNSKCKVSFFMCEYPENTRIIRSISKSTFSNLENTYLYDQRNELRIVVTSNDQLQLKIKGIALSDIEDSKLDYDPLYDTLFNEFFMKKGSELSPIHFVRSAIIKLSAYQGIHDNVKPIKIDIFYNPVGNKASYLNHKKKYLLCLGILQDNNMWKCAAKQEKNTQTSKKLAFKIKSDGTYAIIFNPSLEPGVFNEDVYCGLVCENKRLAFIVLFMGIPVIICFMYILYKV